MKDRKDLTYDFITDHPMATLGIFLGAASLLSSVADMSSKQRYEIAEKEARKKALRRQYMREHPYRLSDYLSSENWQYFFCEFAYNRKPQEIKHWNKKLLIKRWNKNHCVDMWGFKIYPSYKETDDEEQQNACLSDMVEHFKESKTMQRIKDTCWKLYLESVEEGLILSGAY